MVLATTAGEALVNLHASGFDWEFLLRDYTESRNYSIEVALLIGMMEGYSGKRDPKGALEKWNTTSPQEELSRLADRVFEEMRLLETQWDLDPLQADPPTPFRDLLLFHYEHDAPRTWNPGELTEEHFHLTRAVDYFVRNRQSAPLVGWALAAVELLRHVRPDAEVVFDISGGFSNFGSGSPDEYAQEFWSSARAELASVARFYGHVFSGIAAATTDFAQAAQYGRLEAMLEAAGEPGITSNLRGQRLEDLVAGIIEIPGTSLQIVEKRLRRADEELDLVLRNDLEDAFWRGFNSPVVIVECKNWSSVVGVNELRVLETKMKDRQALCSLGIFVSLEGFSQPFLRRARELPAQGLTIFPLDAEDIRALLRGRTTLPEWLRKESLRRVL